MKKVLMFCSVSLLTFLFSLSFNACVRDITIDPSLVQTKESVDPFVDAFTTGLENLAENEVIDVFHKDGKLDWNVSRNLYDITLRAHDCSGTALSVAKCSKAIIDAGGCVKAGKDRGGDYWADKVSCK